MIVIPAIDLRDSRCVRLLQGRFDEETIYSDNPLEMAGRWRDGGASLIHVVDLDGAKGGNPAHFDIISDIINKAGVDVEVGGGIRCMDTVDRYMAAGVRRVIIGTAVITDPDFAREAAAAYKGRVMAGIDARNGCVAVKGWLEDTAVRTTDLFYEVAKMGMAGLIYTDILKDGTLNGIDTRHLSDVISKTELPFVVSGGVSTIDDVAALCDMNHPQIEGVIIGKALYDGTISLEDAVRLVRA